MCLWNRWAAIQACLVSSWAATCAREKEREREIAICNVLCAEKHQEKAVEIANESKNVVQGESYVGGRVVQ